MDVPNYVLLALSIVAKLPTLVQNSLGAFGV